MPDSDRLVPADRSALAELLAREGFIAAEEEAAELWAHAGGDAALLQECVARRLTGEPLAWITGHVDFCGVRVGVRRGVYVPRWHTEMLARRAAARLPRGGVAVDVCCGSGAVARVLMSTDPFARVLACDVDPLAVECAMANGVEAYCGDLFAPLPGDVAGAVDVVVGVVPYVPTAELPLLQRDTFTFESTLAYDGGDDGAAVLRRVVAESPRLLRPGGALLLELGGRQAELLRDALVRSFGDVHVLRDDDGDPRGVEVTFMPGPA